MYITIHVYIKIMWVYSVEGTLHVFSADISNLADILLDIHHVAPKWKSVGLLLRLHPNDLGVIEANHVKEGVESCLCVVVEKWLNRSYDTATHGLPSWKMLVTAITHPIGGNNPALAEQIATKHSGKSDDTVCVCTCIYVYLLFHCSDLYIQTVDEHSPSIILYLRISRTGVKSHPPAPIVHILTVAQL